MKNKKVLVKWLKESTPETEWFVEKDKEVYISIREAEAWARVGLCDIIDTDVEVIKERYNVGRSDEFETITIKPREKQK